MLLAERSRSFDPHVVDARLDGRAQFLSLRDRVTESRVSFGDLVHASEHDWDLK